MAPRSREHIITGGGTIAARVLQLLIALVVVCLAAYGLVYRRFSGLELNMFTACVTVVVCAYLLLTTTLNMSVPFYNYWAALCFDLFGFAFWITSFGLMVSQIRPFYRDNYYYSGCDWYYGSCYYKREVNIVKRSNTSFYVYRNSMGAIAAMAGLEMLIFMATFISVALFISDHRSDGGHALYSRQGITPITQQGKDDLEMQPAVAVHEPFAAHLQPESGRGNPPLASAPTGGATTT